MEMVGQMNLIKMENEQLRHRLETEGEEQQHLKTQLGDAIHAEKEALKSQGQVLRELHETSQTLDEIKMELHNTRLGKERTLISEWMDWSARID